MGSCRRAHKTAQCHHTPDLPSAAAVLIELCTESRLASRCLCAPLQENKGSDAAEPFRAVSRYLRDAQPRNVAIQQ